MTICCIVGVPPIAPLMFSANMFVQYMHTTGDTDAVRARIVGPPMVRHFRAKTQQGGGGGRRKGSGPGAPPPPVRQAPRGYQLPRPQSTPPKIAQANGECVVTHAENTWT